MWQDLRYAVRTLRRTPAFAATAISMLALGLCASVAIFGFVDAALVRSLPYLVVAELAIAAILLGSGGLLGKGLYRLLHVDAGFNTRKLATLAVSPVPVRPQPGEPNREQSGALAQRVAERVAALPGVQAVGYADLLPLGPGLAPSSGFQVVGRSAQGVVEDHPVRRVSVGYFTALQATLLSGRYFTEEEVASTRLVTIINESAGRRYFPGEEPVG